MQLVQSYRILLSPVTLNAQKIAVIDDDPLMRTALKGLLKDNGFEAYTFADSSEFNKYGHMAFDVFLIDLRLVNESGLDIVRELCKTRDAPVIMLSGVGDEIDKAIGLETGADDFVSKPFNPRELIARIRALLRRYKSIGASSKDTLIESNDQLIRFGEFTVDLKQRQLTTSSGSEVTLTNAEFRLLEYLVTHHSRIIDRAELMSHIGSDASDYADRTIDVMILRLRGKIEARPSKPVHLQTRRGKGYVFIMEP